MTNYATLTSDTIAFSARSDLSSQIPTFIRLAEARIARDIRVLEMQTRTTLTVPDTGSVALPTGFLGFRHVAFVNQPGLAGSAELTYLSPDQFHELRINRETFSGIIPDNYYTVEAGNFLLQPQPGTGQTTDVDVAYWQRFTELNDVTNTTNWLLTNHSDIYLAAVLKELWGYVMDDEQELRWNVKYDNKVKALHRSERRKQRSGPHVRRPRFAP